MNSVDILISLLSGMVGVLAATGLNALWQKSLQRHRMRGEYIKFICEDVSKLISQTQELLDNPRETNQILFSIYLTGRIDIFEYLIPYIKKKNKPEIEKIRKAIMDCREKLSLSVDYETVLQKGGNNKTGVKLLNELKKLMRDIHSGIACLK